MQKTLRVVFAVILSLTAVDCVLAQAPNAIGTNDNSPIIPELIQALGLKDSFRELHPDDPGYTSDGVLNPIKGGKSRSRLDYILYRPGKDVDVRPVLSQLAYNKPGEYVSDHFGLHTRFELVKKAA